MTEWTAVKKITFPLVTAHNGGGTTVNRHKDSVVIVRFSDQRTRSDWTGGKTCTDMMIPQIQGH